jgi:hypothetical protein
MLVLGTVTVLRMKSGAYAVAMTSSRCSRQRPPSPLRRCRGSNCEHHRLASTSPSPSHRPLHARRRHSRFGLVLSFSGALFRWSKPLAELIHFVPALSAFWVELISSRAGGFTEELHFRYFRWVWRAFQRRM